MQHCEEAFGYSFEKLVLYAWSRGIGTTWIGGTMKRELFECFGCKREKFKGHCICRDGLTPVLDAIRESDGLIIGSPNYLSNVTASFRALYERLIFQNLTYNRENPCCKERDISVLFIMTSNAPDTMYSELVSSYQQTFNCKKRNVVRQSFRRRGKRPLRWGRRL